VKSAPWTCLILPLPVIAAAPQYTLTDLGSIDYPGAGLGWQLPLNEPANYLPSLGGLPTANIVEASFPEVQVGNSAITGSGTNIPPTVHAALWKGNTITDLGTLPGAVPIAGEGASSNALAVNSLGDVVGYSKTQYPTYFTGFHNSTHAFLWHGGVMHDLGTLAGDPGYSSSAEGVNDSHEVVGKSDAILTADHSVVSRAFLYMGGALYNLYFQLVTRPPNIRLTDASGINCQGNIAATGVNLNSGEYHAYLLTRQGPPRNCPH
jgi:probable HAF family extracellular repeat protein